MTEERLEELIKQEAEIYVVENKDIFKYKLHKKARPILCSDVLYILSYDIPYEYPLDQIFETITDAEKELERQVWKEKVNAERTERFEPPMWEDIENSFTFRWFTDGNEYVFTVNKEDDILLIGLAFEYCNEFDKPATKENYEKACEIVRDLFTGEKK